MVPVGQVQDYYDTDLVLSTMTEMLGQSQKRSFCERSEKIRSVCGEKLEGQRGKKEIGILIDELQSAKLICCLCMFLVYICDYKNNIY